MKKIISLLLIIATLAISLVSLASCGEEDAVKNMTFELMEDNTYKLAKYDGELTEVEVPAVYEDKYVTVIGGEAFRETAVTKVTLPHSIKKIEYDAFYRAENLKEVILNEGLETIAISAFFGCAALETVVIPSTVTEIGERAFDACNALNNVVIPANLRKVYPLTFMGCVGLKTVVLDNAAFAAADDVEAAGCATKYADAIYVKDTITVIGKVISKNYVAVTSDKEGYVKYTPKPIED